MANDNNADSKAALASITNHPKSAVRENLLSKVNVADEFWVNAFTRALTDSSYDVVKVALTKLCTAYPKDIAGWINKTNTVYGMNNAVRIKWLELCVNYNEGNVDAHLAELEKYAGPLYEFRTRINAFNALKSLNYFGINVCLSLFQAMLSTNGRLASPAADLLNNFATQTAYKNMAKALFLKQNIEPWQKEMLIKQAPFLSN